MTTITCYKCGATVTDTTIQAIAWDEAHQKECRGGS